MPRCHSPDAVESCRVCLSPPKWMEMAAEWEHFKHPPGTDDRIQEPPEDDFEYPERFASEEPVLSPTQSTTHPPRTPEIRQGYVLVDNVGSDKGRRRSAPNGKPIAEPRKRGWFEGWWWFHGA